MKDIKVAIVGSSESHWSAAGRVKAIIYIHDLLDEFSTSWLVGKVTLISGGSPKGGVDIWAEMVADHLKLDKKIFLAENNNWQGYKSRNIQITEACDVLYCIDPKGRSGGGGFWTYSKAKILGKEVHHVVID